MSIGEAIIIGSIINLIGMIIFMHFRDNAWFKKENFKMQKSMVMSENKLKLKKLGRELGVDVGKSVPAQLGLLEQLKGLDLDKVQGLLSMVQKPDDYAPEPDLKGQLLDFANNNPEMVQNFLSGITQGQQQNKVSDKFYER